MSRETGSQKRHSHWLIGRGFGEEGLEFIKMSVAEELTADRVVEALY